MVNTYLILALMVVGVILIIYAFTTIFHPGPKKASTTTNTITSANTVTPAPGVPATVSFYDVNVQNVYNGPATFNGTKCNYATYTYIDSESLTVNGSENFNLQFKPSSGNCPETLTSVSSGTPGFIVTSTMPSLPYYLPPNSQFQLQINMRAPSTSYYGPLTITVTFN